MKTIILYASYRGHTKRLAEKIAALLGAELEGVVFGTWRIFPHMIGIRGGNYPILDLSGYDIIYAGGPVWMARPSPGFSKLLKNLELSGKEIKCFSRSGGGNTDKVEGKLAELAKEKEFELAKSVVISGKASEEEVDENIKDLIS
jgi:flavodoxin